MENKPNHVGIIMDGNGRWAQKRGLPRNEGHRNGVENLRRILRCAKSLGIHYLTAFAFSAENWARPQKEVGLLLNLLENFLKRHVQELRQHQIRLKVIGRIEDFPANIQKVLRQTVQETSNFSEGTFVLALNYGSRSEVVDAVKAYIDAAREGREQPKDLNWKRFSSYLYTWDIPDPDLIIRTSGETRLSNFLLLQGAYAEWIFSKKLWPDFSPEDFEEAITSYKKKERRFGMTGDQVKNSLPEPLLNK